ncbi:D-alanyl-D-alanine carboxypeptidase family protein [Mesorhizobium xinjiangense]|uniref:D-alanyl-D-alanine carboxypeptidase family protein n=1 Tax=Mesorhizobium xinjiangense TaxID=2678685 RepID=UPI001F23AC8D|nr:D-alanyl-D-alanine carboxypeptidase family protein [Mesorhizobium xinjiangense]
MMYQFCLAAWLATIVAAAPAAAGPSIVVDVNSGRVLAEDDIFQRWYPASLSKLMTAYVAFRAIEAGEVTLQSPVRISRNAAKEPPSKMGYKPGSVLTLDNALKIIMVKSANDVATAIGESIAGSEFSFAARMNAESARLGMTGSHWVNAHGLHSEGQYTTAHDMAVLALAIKREYPQYAGYFTIEGLQAGKAKLENHNTLIGRFDGADGMKTGYTCPAGFNLAASATRGGRTILAVLLGEMSVSERAEKAAGLIAKGFQTNVAGAPHIDMLAPAGDVEPAAVNLRPVVCSQEARQARLENRDENGDTIFESPYLHEFTHEPRLVAVDLGGATGPKSPYFPEEVEYADVPIPTPRPDYTPTSVAAQ